MKFKVGDRVAVYGPRITMNATAFGSCQDVVYGAITADGKFPTIKSDLDDCEYYFHPKQCRLLKRKERKRVWVDPDYLIPNQPYFYKPEKGMPVRTTKGNSWIEFIEVKRKSIVTGDK